MKRAEKFDKAHTTEEARMKRARQSSEETFTSLNELPSTRTTPGSTPSRSAKPARYGCPGDEGRCIEHKHRAWRSFKSFYEHLEAQHLEEYKTYGGLKCLECEKYNLFVGCHTVSPTYLSQGRDLARHIWDDHMTPETNSEQFPNTSFTDMD